MVLGDKISVFVSSTTTDLLSERTAVRNALESYDFVETIGAHPIEIATLGSPSQVTRSFASICDYFVLILADRYGFPVDQSKSATEVEYDAAVTDDPTKIVVFKRQPFSAEPRQQVFADRVGSYYSGQWIANFATCDELAVLVRRAFVAWLISQGGIKNNLSIIDRFIVLAIRLKPIPDCTVEYVRTRSDVSFMYHFGGVTARYDIESLTIVSAFWASLHNVDRFVETLRIQRYGH